MLSLLHEIGALLADVIEIPVSLSNCFISEMGYFFIMQKNL